MATDPVRDAAKMLEFGAHPSSDLPDCYIVHGTDIRALRAALSRPAADASGAEAMRDDICKGCSTYEWCSVTGACLADSDPHDEGDWRRVVSTLTALAPLPPASAGGEVEAARLLPTTLDGVTLIRGDTLQRTIIASPDIYEAFRAAFSAERAAAKGGA